VIHQRQRSGVPVGGWEPLEPRTTGCRRLSRLLVQDCMSASPLTVREEQVIDLAASLMQWRQIRHVPVEDSEHRLVGLVTLRTLLAAASKQGEGGESALAVGEVMVRDVFTIGPEATMATALDLMKEHGIGCLPVVQDGVLVGLLCERDFMEAADTD
jgi:CBS-domain-containing membrane protein